MELEMRGVRSSIAAPLSPTVYKNKCLQLLQLASASNLSGSSKSELEEFLSQQSADIAKLIGGHTACLSVELASGHRLILDCGTGLFELGQELMAGDCGQGKAELHIFLTHLHLDRICGLLHFTPLDVPGNQIHFYYPEDNWELRLLRVQSPPYYDRSLDTVAATTYFHTVKENRNYAECLNIGSAQIRYAPLIHPHTSYAWKISEDPYSVIYAGAGKIKSYNEDNRRSMAPFFNHATIFILDAQIDSPPLNLATAWGHNNYAEAIQMGMQWQAKHIFLFNHAPNVSDPLIWQTFLALQKKQQGPTQIHLAREGQRIQVGLL